MFSFLMKYEHMTFGEALRHLADKAGVALEKNYVQSEKQKKASSEFKKLYELAANFYHEMLLKSKEAEGARRYLNLRGYGIESIKRFKLGYASSHPQDFFQFATKQNFSEKALLESGLFRQPEPGRFTDLFRSRILFPILNVRGEVIAFGGRVLDDSLPKYLNSPETKFFKKRTELYGLNWSKRTIPKAGFVFIVEGYFDFHRLFESGFENSVATLGTSLTEDHARLLRRYTQKVVVLFDNDPAGIQAALRGV